jgi:hypothetical protein
MMGRINPIGEALVVGTTVATAESLGLPQKPCVDVRAPALSATAAVPAAVAVPPVPVRSVDGAFKPFRCPPRGLKDLPRKK